MSQQQQVQTTTFTGRTRARRTSWRVHAADVVSRVLISIGGIGTIVAVSTVCVFLVWVVLPLFSLAEMGLTRGVAASWSGPARVLRIGVDEYQTMGWALLADGTVLSFRLDDGTELSRVKLSLIHI